MWPSGAGMGALCVLCGAPLPLPCPTEQILETPSLLASSSSTFGLKAKQPEAASSCCG